MTGSFVSIRALAAWGDTGSAQANASEQASASKRELGINPGLIRVQATGGQDFTIPTPQSPTNQNPQAPAPPPTPSGTGASPFSGLERAPTNTEFALGAAALVVLAVVFLLVRQGVRAHLINRRATLDAADGASWMLFSALMLTGTILVGATVGRLWQAWAGLAVGFGLCAVLFCAALVLFLRAPDRRR